MFTGIFSARLVSVLVLLVAASHIDAQRANITSLQYVHTIWRHGDRTPLKETFPSDLGNRADTWSEGFGELTMKGVREHYELGKYLRQRYDGFLSKAYHASQIYVRSSSFNRAIMSASANMAGLFEPEGDQLWNKQIRWQPVPIQVVPKENDPMLWTKRPCPAATQLFEDFKKSSSELRRIEQKYARLLTFLGQKTGLNRTLQLYNDVYDVFDLLNCQHDSTIAALFNNLGAMQPHAPPYAALLMIELHQIKEQHFVEIYYRNDTTRDAYHIDIGECPRPCTLNQFGARSVPRIPRDWYKECGINECRDQKSLRI